MNLDKWIMSNYTLLYDTTLNIIKNKSDVDDVLHSVLEQILDKKKEMDLMEDKNKLYYFIRVVKNNYFSKTSKYHYQHRKYPQNEQELNLNQELVDEEYVEQPDMDWVKKQLDELNWFDRDLFLLWLELGTITAVSKKTTIPLNSVGRYINEIKTKLIQRWENRY